MIVNNNTYEADRVHSFITWVKVQIVPC